VIGQRRRLIAQLDAAIARRPYDDVDGADEERAAIDDEIDRLRRAIDNHDEDTRATARES
jgi:hypothetical protein